MIGPWWKVGRRSAAKCLFAKVEDLLSAWRCHGRRRRGELLEFDALPDLVQRLRGRAVHELDIPLVRELMCS